MLRVIQGRADTFILEPADIWCAEVFDWPKLRQHEAMKVLNMTQRLTRGSGADLLTTRCPIRIDGERPSSQIPAPRVGEHTAILKDEIGLK